MINRLVMLVPLLVVFALIAWRRSRKKPLSVEWLVVLMLMCGYWYALLGVTFLPMLRGEAGVWRIAWSLSAITAWPVKQIVGNALMLAPFAYLLAMLAPRCRHFWPNVGASLAVTLGIECAQLVLGYFGWGRRSFDVLDLLLNLAGALLGYGLFRLTAALIAAK